MKLLTIISIAICLGGCIDFESKPLSFTPMECKKFGEDYVVKWTQKNSILDATPSKVTIRNENDGKIIVLSDEADWACTVLGSEIPIHSN